MRGTWTSGAVVGAVLVSAVVAAPAGAAGPSIEVLRVSASAGVVADNPVWSGRPVRWTVRIDDRPERSRIVTQVLRSDRWTTIPTLSRRVGATVSGSYRPLSGSWRYRVAVVDSTGRVLAAARGWPTVGLRTYALSRVVTSLPGPVPAERITVDGRDYPALWRVTTALGEPAGRALAVRVPAGRCRAVLVAGRLSYGGPAATAAEVDLTVLHQSSVDTIVPETMRLSATSPGADTATLTVANDEPPSAPFFAIWPTSRAEERLLPPSYAPSRAGAAWASVPWTDGTALLGGVALCSSAVR